MARQPRTADTWRRTRTSGRESLRSSPGISSPTFFLFSSRRRHTVYWRDWSSGVCSSDLDYERWPTPPDHPLRGAEILRERGYPDDVIYAIKSHADYLAHEAPRVSRLDKALYACDELCGFITACALVRPDRLEGLTARSVRKKMKQPSFAAAVRREDIANGAADLGVDLDEHIEFCIAAMREVAGELGLTPQAP